jgi:hypothetical protein
MANPFDLSPLTAHAALLVITVRQHIRMSIGERSFGAFGTVTDGIQARSCVLADLHWRPTPRSDAGPRGGPPTSPAAGSALPSDRVLRSSTRFVPQGDQIMAGAIDITLEQALEAIAAARAKAQQQGT